jgi:trafficking protein particle complex subunit 3
MATRTNINSNSAGAATANSSSNNNNPNNNISSQGMALWAKQSKCNAEFFALTYGALVAELLRDLEDDASVTAELDRMGHSIGVRCIEEVLAKANYNSSNVVATQSFAADTPDICALAFRMFLGLQMDVHRGGGTGGGGSSDASTTSYTLVFADNPLATFVELPKEREGLEYSQLYAGMIRGMLEMLQFDVTATVTKTVLRGHDTNEITVELQQILQDGAGDDYHEE